MKPHAKRALGIDITGRRINAVLIEKHEHGFKTLAVAGGDLHGAESGRGRLAQLAGVPQVLKRLDKAMWARRIETAVAVSTDSTVIRVIDMPGQTPTNVGEFVASELRQCVALSGKTIVSDFCGIGVGSGLHRRLLAAAAEAGEVRRKVTACSRAGAAIKAVEPAILAYARAFFAQRGQGRHEGATVIAMLNSRNLTLGTFIGTALDFVRVRALPSEVRSAESLCAWLADELKAIRQFHDMEASPNGGDWQVHVVVHDSEYPAEDIKRLMTVQTGLGPVAVIDPCESPDGLQGPPQVSMIALGAALRLLAAEDSDLRINLIPGEVVRERLFSRHMLVTANMAAVMLLGIFLTTQLLARTADVRNRRIEQTKLSERLHTATALMIEEKSVDGRMAGLRQRLGPLHRAMDGRPEVDWPGVLRAVVRAMPPEVRTTQWSCEDGRTLSLRGMTPSCEAAQTFVQHLEGAGPFTAVFLARVDRRQDDGGLLEYQIDCSLKTSR